DEKMVTGIDKVKYPNLTESGYCIHLARMVQNPLMEYLRLGDKVISIEFHPLQCLLSESKLMEALDRAFINVVNEVGVDINDLLNNNVNSLRILNYICGFGPQTSIRFKSLVFGNNPEIKPFINSRFMLKNFLEPKIYQNSAGFFK